MSDVEIKKEKNKEEELFTRKNANVIMNFATLQKLITADLKNNRNTIQYFQQYTKEDIRTYLQSPQSYEKILRELSNSLYVMSPHYRRLINYFSKMLLFRYVVEPYKIDIETIDVNTLKKKYLKTLDIIEDMNIAHEFIKILNIAFIDDIFYGYVHESNDSFFIQKLDPQYCMLSSIEDGVFNFAFNFSYFDSNKDKLINYPAEFTTKYNQYLRDRIKWIELDPQSTICIKINEDVAYPMPPFIGILEYVLELEDYQALKKTENETDNFKILAQKIPMRENSDNNNDYAITLDHVTEFHGNIGSTLPDQIGLISSPMEIKEIDINKKRYEKDSVQEAERSLYNAEGVSQLLFNSDKGGSIGLERSINTDEVIAFAVLRQIERWINRKLKYTSTTRLFKINMLNITRYNEDEFFEKSLKAAQFGIPTKLMTGASMGLSPSAMTNMAFLENTVLGLEEALIPLASSHTQNSDTGSTDNTGGRPSKNTNKLSQSGESQKDNNKNKNRAKKKK